MIDYSIALTFYISYDFTFTKHHNSMQRYINEIPENTIVSITLERGEVVELKWVHT